MPLASTRTAPHLRNGPLSGAYPEGALLEVMRALRPRLHPPDGLCGARVERLQLLLEGLPRPRAPAPHADDPGQQQTLPVQSALVWPDLLDSPPCAAVSAVTHRQQSVSVAPPLTSRQGRAHESGAQHLCVVPCSSSTSAEPALVCRRSTFCVMSASTQPAACNRHTSGA